MLAMQTLYIDCANGVGACKIQAMAPLLAEAGVVLDLRNTGEGVLNGECGSDFLKDRKLPQNFGDMAEGARWVGRVACWALMGAACGCKVRAMDAAHACRLLGLVPVGQ